METITKLRIVESEGELEDCGKCVFKDVCDTGVSYPCDIRSWNRCYFVYDNDKEDINNG